MSYCSAADVQNEFKNLTFGASTTPTDTQVAAFCDQESAKIDAKLAARFVTPITGAVSLALLKPFAIALVANRVAAILRVKTGDKGIDQGPSVFMSRKDAEAGIQAMYEGKIQLLDATLISGADGVRSWVGDAGTDDVSNVPNFNRGVAQW